MGDVIDMHDFRPHRQGPAMCLHCGHKWHAVVPHDYDSFECPGCSLTRGVFEGICAPPEGEPTFLCDCGCYRFELLRNGAFCINCGAVHGYEDLAGG